MKTIYKYQLPFKDYSLLKLPYYSEILSAINQYEQIIVYVLLDTEQTQYHDYIFYVVGTGHEITDEKSIGKGNFLNTVSFRDGNLIFHVFYSVYE